MKIKIPPQLSIKDLKKNIENNLDDVRGLRLLLNWIEAKGVIAKIPGIDAVINKAKEVIKRHEKDLEAERLNQLLDDYKIAIKKLNQELQNQEELNQMLQAFRKELTGYFAREHIKEQEIKARIEEILELQRQLDRVVARIHEIEAEIERNIEEIVAIEKQKDARKPECVREWREAVLQVQTMFGFMLSDEQMSKLEKHFDACTQNKNNPIKSSEDLVIKLIEHIESDIKQAIDNKENPEELLRQIRGAMRKLGQLKPNLSAYGSDCQRQQKLLARNQLIEQEMEKLRAEARELRHKISVKEKALPVIEVQYHEVAESEIDVEPVPIPNRHDAESALQSHHIGSEDDDMDIEPAPPPTPKKHKDVAADDDMDIEPAPRLR